MIKKLFNITILTLSIIAITIASFSYTLFAENNDIISIDEKSFNKFNDFKTNIWNYDNYISNNIKHSTDILGSINVSIDRNSYPIIQNYDLNNTTESTNYNSLSSYISQDTSGSIQLTIDSNFPIFLGFTKNSYVWSSYELYQYNPSLICLPFDELAYYSDGTQSVANIITEIWGLVNGQSSNIINASVQYSFLYQLGYRIYTADYINNSGMTGYLYTFAKFVDYERLNYYGNTNSTFNSTQDTIYFDRLTFSTSNYFSNYYNNQNVSYYSLLLNASDFGLTDFNSTMIYDSNNLLYCSKVSNSQLIITFIPGKTDYSLTLFRYLSFYNNHTAHTTLNKSLNIIYDDEYSFINSNGSNINYTNQLNNINNNLIDIKTLLSDLQVTEINNIYNDIVNNYNVDIDTEINNYLDDLQININALDINNQKFQIPSNLNNQLSGLKNMFSNVFTTLDNNNAALFYIVPIVALIIGALL